mmetsp:Transcript_22794/g.33075  ORF Transcript_22794/g.33075 Transcript_22794/m.33075 type:complete len:611 (-) Transcript_22794:196-2028(-)
MAHRNILNSNTEYLRIDFTYIVLLFVLFASSNGFSGPSLVTSYNLSSRGGYASSTLDKAGGSTNAGQKRALRAADSQLFSSPCTVEEASAPELAASNSTSLLTEFSDAGIDEGSVLVATRREYIDVDEDTMTKDERLNLREVTEKVVQGKAGVHKEGEEMVAPSYKELLLFTMPTLAAWIAAPVMSMVDTAVVGRQSSVELAALGPATNIIDTGLYLFCFLGISTSNLVSRAIAQDDNKETQKVVSHALAISLVCGLLLATTVQVLGPALLGATVGASSLEVIPAAYLFSRVRIIGGVFVLLNWAAQSALLGAKDSVTPFKVVLLTGVLNIVGDIFLVCKMGMGILGAAVATSCAEVFGCAVMLTALAKKMGKREYPFMKMPPLPELKKFVALAGPIFYIFLCQCIMYYVLNAVSTSYGTVTLAAHQVVMRVFMLSTPFGDALSQTAQTYLSQNIERSKKKPQMQQMIQKTMKRIITLSLVVGTLSTGLACIIPLKLPTLFTTDPLIIAEIAKLVPMLAASLTLNTAGMALEGILIAQNDLMFMAKSYSFTTAMVLAYELFFVKAQGGSLFQVWGGLVVFTFLRCLQFATRFGWKKWKSRQSITASLKVA